MEIASLITGPVDVNTYIVYGKNKGECIVIDPSDTELVNKKLNQLDVKPTAVLLTHVHFDHIVSVADIQRQYNARVYRHEIDEPGLRDPKVNLCDMAHIAIPPCHADVKLKGGETVHESGFDIKVISTPGHTKGSLSYAIEDNGRKALFTGDCLFRLSIGRSDFPGGDHKELLDSIGKALFTLDGDYEVYPGHMGASTLQFEREHNPFMRRWSRKQL